MLSIWHKRWPGTTQVEAEAILLYKEQEGEGKRAGKLKSPQVPPVNAMECAAQ